MPSRQYVKEDAHSAVSNNANKSYRRNNRATGRRGQKRRHRQRSASRQQVVVPTTELSPERALDSGINYSARKYQVGAGRVANEPPVETVTNVSRERSLSDFVMHVPKLNSEMGTETDDDWQPSESIGSFLEEAESSRKHEAGESKEYLWVPSPPTWSSKKRQSKLEQDDFVEIPKEVVQYEKMWESLKAQRLLIQQQMLLEKGKDCVQADQGTRKDTGQKDHRRSKPTRRTGSHDLSSIHNNEPVLTSPAAVNASRPVQEPSESKGNAQDQAGARPKQHQHSHHGPNKIGGNSYERFHVPTDHQSACTCSLLPPYFSQDPDAIPSLATWSGSIIEFLSHVYQMSQCFGHSLYIRDACRRICKDHNYPSQLGDQATMSFAQVSPTIATEPPSDTQLSTNPRGDDMRAVSMMSRSRSDLAKSGSQTSSWKQPPKLTFPNTIPISERFSAVFSSRSSADADESSPPILRASSTPNRGFRWSTTDSDAQLHPTTWNSDPEANRRQVVVTASTVSWNELPPTSFNLRSRHQSLPAFAFRRGDDDWPTAQMTLLNAIEQPSISAATLGEDTLVGAVVTLRNEVNQMKLNQSDQVTPNATAPTPAADAQVVQTSPPAKKKRKTAAERKAAGKPELCRDVAQDLRLSDRKLLKIGRKTKNGYERHTKAPYAFSYRGRLYAEYKYLLSKLNSNGDPVWNFDIINRVRP